MSTAQQSSNRWPIAFVVTVALLAMFRAAGNDWSHYDDDLFLFRNPHYDPPTISSFAYYWSHGFRGLWTPLTHSAWWIVAKFSQLDNVGPAGVRLNPWTFHAFNIALHCAASGLVFLLVRRAVTSPWAALAGAVVFAAHPVQVEAVAWACGTKDVLATLFAVAAILMATSTRGRAWTVIAAIACAALAMLSKPSAVVLPAMMVAYTWILARPRNESRAVPGPKAEYRDRGVDGPALNAAWRTWVAIGTSLLIAGPVLIIARRVQIIDDVPPISLLARPIVALDAIAMHLRHIIFPTGLCADYGLTPQQLLNSPRRFWTWIVPIAAALVAFLTRDRRMVGGAAIFVIALAPNLGLAAFQFQVYSTVADRYAYLAMPGVAIAVAGAVSLIEDKLLRTARRQRANDFAIAATGALCIALVPISFLRCGDWRGPAALWARTLAVNPTSALGHNNLGASLMAMGDLPGALAHFEAAANGPTDSFALLNLAQLHVRLGHADAAADAVLRLLDVYHRRSDYDPELERQTVDRFAGQIERIDPQAAESLRQRARR